MREIKMTATYEEYSWLDWEDHYTGGGETRKYDKEFTFSEGTTFKEIRDKAFSETRLGETTSKNGDYSIYLEDFTVENIYFQVCEIDYDKVTHEYIFRDWDKYYRLHEDTPIMKLHSLKDMSIRTIDDNNTDFSLVELRDDGNIGRKTPHCKKHGAMNKVGEKYWRCSASKMCGCRAGCIED